MIETEALTKRYGSTAAVDSVSFRVQPGKVTGFLGPNGAGKSTTMRMIVGLARPTSGSVTVNGRPYSSLRSPLTEVGALLDAKAVHAGRSAMAHLRALGATHGIGATRIKKVIEMTGLESVAHKRVGSFSLGMGQRLGIASALVGDPHTLILDEPVNGLDPDGVQWVRRLARGLADEGRTVFLSSHLMSEMALTADHLIVLGRGRVLKDAPMADVLASASGLRLRVRTPRSNDLARLLIHPDITVSQLDQNTIETAGIAAADLGDVAARHGIALHELTPLTISLEEAYMALTQDAVEYRSEISA